MTKTSARTRTTAPQKRSSASAGSVVTTGSIVAAAGVAALAGTAFLFRHQLMALLGYERIHFAPHIREQLPIAKDLQTIPDTEGNYDMDGVSFDSEGVVVGSDRTSHTLPQSPH